MAMKETQQVEIKGQYTTSEVTHVLEALKLEGMCYVKNHLFMQIGGDTASGPVRQWHDNVTRQNLDTLKGIAKEMGLNLPFPQKLEDRENQLKSKVQGTKVANILTDGEILTEVKTAAVNLNNFYTVSMDLAMNDRVREAFRRGRENIADNMPQVIDALRQTDMFYPPPIAHQIGYMAEKGQSSG